ncbi:MAG TPA: DUF1365 domain-containing protein [Gemmatimonadaceae bacterium]|nr:DUF1365 domain-containing protein [Gemmatimonadaceae bacterium]
MNAPVHSAIYRGAVRHRRFFPVPHEFRFPLFMLYLDLDELPGLLPRSPLFGAERARPLSFHRADHAGDPARPLADVVRDEVERAGGRRPEGPIRLLTHVRTFGHVFNPVSFFYCFDARGERVESVVGEVTNIPWRERHLYVGHERADEGRNAGKHRWQFTKAMHVSPLMGMNQRYDWRFTDPGHRLAVQMDVTENGRTALDATLVMSREPLTNAALAANMVRFPLMTLQVVAAIHFQAFRVWWKGNPYYPRPPRPAALPSERSA